jgi:general secretion pathway protein B
MSVILDALKKLDREKYSLRKGTGNIAVEILRSDPARPRKRILLYFAAVSLATAAIIYALMVEFGFLSKSSPPSPVNPTAPSQQIEPAPLELSFPSKPSIPAPVNPPVPSQPVAPATPSREPVPDARDEISRVPPKIENPAESKSPATSLDEKKAREADVAPRTTKKPAEPTPTESVSSPQSLRISGIVWHEDPSERLVVINGMILHEGSEIEGAKVVEIHPTHVRFLHKDQPFEISIFR